MYTFEAAEDIHIICELLSLNAADFSEQIGVSSDTITRWKYEKNAISRDNLNKIYDYAFSKGIKLNIIKEQLYREDCQGENHVLLFHGAKVPLDGALSLDKSKGRNDFGNGFYCGENLEQSAMFVAGYPDSVLYIADFDTSGLSCTTYFVNLEWMLTIAYFRGCLQAYADHPMIQSLKQKAEGADYILAPIADNRMFEIIDSFIDGEITDIQCQHCLSATSLGSQYVFKTDKALQQLSLKCQCFLCEREKKFYLTSKQEEAKVGNDKVKIARRQFRGQGDYIEDILR